MSILDNLQRKQGVVRDVLTSQPGQELLAIMHDEFDMPDLRGDSVEETYYNLGRRDAVIYLEQLRDANIDG